MASLETDSWLVRRLQVDQSLLMLQMQCNQTGHSSQLAIWPNSGEDEHILDSSLHALQEAYKPQESSSQRKHDSCILLKGQTRSNPDWWHKACILLEKAMLPCLDSVAYALMKLSAASQYCCCVFSRHSSKLNGDNNRATGKQQGQTHKPKSVSAAESHLMVCY